MRIFYASDTTPNSSFESNIWRNNLYLPLVDLGHDVVEFQYDLNETFRNLDNKNPKQKVFIDKNRPKVTNEVLRQIKLLNDTKPIDLFFSYFYDACILPEAIDKIKEMGIKTVNWYCNGSYQLHLVSEISPHYDWCLVPEKFRLKDYIAMGANPIYCQEAANPKIYKPYDLPIEFDVTFVGQAYGDRPAYIKHLLDNNIDVRVWGLGWDNFSAGGEKSQYDKNLVKKLKYTAKGLLTHGSWKSLGGKIKRLNKTNNNKHESQLELTKTSISLPNSIIGKVLSDLELIQMFSRSKINLGFSTCGNTHETKERILQIRLRDFEVPMSGGFYIVEYMEEIEEFYDIGKEIICYRDKEDLAQKIKYYLKHDEEREVIRKAGYARCLRDHTWHKRFETAFQEMALS